MSSARAVVARAPLEILNPSDFGANPKAMGKWCILFLSLHTPQLLIFSQRCYLIDDSCVELIGLYVQWYPFYIFIGQFHKLLSI